MNTSNCKYDVGNLVPGVMLLTVTCDPIPRLISSHTLSIDSERRNGTEPEMWWEV